MNGDSCLSFDIFGDVTSIRTAPCMHIKKRQKEKGNDYETHFPQSLIITSKHGYKLAAFTNLFPLKVTPQHLIHQNKSFYTAQQRSKIARLEYVT